VLIDPGRTQRLLACMGDPSRFRVIEKLMASSFCVTDLAREIGLSQSCTTRHLQVLQKEGLVIGLRSGKRVVFRLRTEEPMIAGLVTWALAHAGPAAEARKPRQPSAPRSTVGETGAAVMQADRLPVEVDTSTPRPRASVARNDDMDDFLL
jgi:DNA-binding transcriptional ArsR family regulator